MVPLLAAGCLKSCLSRVFLTECCCLGVQERRQKEKALDKARKGRTEEQKELSKKFYSGLIQESDYHGEDYEVFSSWLGQTA